MNKFFITISLSFITACLLSQSEKTILLNQPDTTKGLPLMKTLAIRSSERDFDTTSLKLQDLSDLLWAANGVNRPESGKRTAPSAMNSQEVDIYVSLKSGVYFYNAQKSQLEFIVENDLRHAIADRQQNMASAPVFLLLVSDISRLKYGNDSSKVVIAALDAGIVSQNISLFCASAGFSTVPRATMNHQKLKQLLQLKDTQHLMLNHPVAYKKK